MTDRPEYYQCFKNQVEVIEVDTATLAQWRGQYDFFWRIKMRAIEDVVKLAPNDDVLYVDSDTFLAGHLEHFEPGLRQGIVYMHECEGKLSQLQSKTERSMWKHLHGKTFGAVTIDANAEMWNAGVILLPAEKAAEAVALAIELCDEMCATDCTRRLLEQFAFSLALKHRGPLQAANREIGHYWGNKSQWNTLITEFLMYSKLTESTLEQDLARLREINFRDRLTT